MSTATATATPRVVLEKRLYTAHATAVGGRDGTAKTDDGRLAVTVNPPRELGGSPSAQGTNPEQLFAVGYAACFGSAIAHVAKLQKLSPGPISVTAHVAIGPSGPGYGLAVELVAEVPGLPREQAEAVVAKAHEVCPYSNATRGNLAVDVRLA